MLTKETRRAPSIGHKRLAANQLFKDSLDKFKQRFSDAAPDSFAGLDRIAGDPRATDVWDLIARHPENAHKFFYQIIDVFWMSNLGMQEREWSYYDSHKTRSDIEDAIKACTFLGQFCVTSAAMTSPLRYADYAKTMPSNLLSMSMALEDELYFYVRALGTHDGRRRDRHAVFIEALSDGTHQMFGQPHDKVVAAVASVLFERNIDPDTVKMTRHRARKRKPWVRPPWALRAGTAPLGG